MPLTLVARKSEPRYIPLNSETLYSGLQSDEVQAMWRDPRLFGEVGDLCISLTPTALYRGMSLTQAEAEIYFQFSSIKCHSLYRAIF